MENREQERNFELRSEKVRSIVGQIPSSLIRYGITAIGVVLASLFVIAYFLPYKQVYSGTATVYEVPTLSTDSMDVAVFLKFENKRPGNLLGQEFYLQTAATTLSGELLHLSAVRDTLERQEALCRFSTESVQLIANQTVDFQIVQYSSNLLQKMLGDIWR